MDPSLRRPTSSLRRASGALLMSTRWVSPAVMLAPPTQVANGRRRGTLRCDVMGGWKPFRLQVDDLDRGPLLDHPPRHPLLSANREPPSPGQATQGCGVTCRGGGTRWRPLQGGQRKVPGDFGMGRMEEVEEVEWERPIDAIALGYETGGYTGCSLPALSNTFTG